MNKIKILAATCLIGSSAAFAVGDLWDFPSMLTTGNDPYNGQVKTPGVIACWADAPPPTAANEYFSPCYGESGGWWFGYGDAGGVVYDKDSGKDLTADRAVQLNEYVDGEGQVVITGSGLGNSAKGDANGGLRIRYELAGGSAEEPSVAGIGFNWNNKDGANFNNRAPTENISGKGSICLKYKASADGIDVELGWNESSYGYDTWVASLPASSDWKVVTLNFNSDFHVSYESASDEHELSIALNEAEALKIASKNKESGSKTINFELNSLGWGTTCGTPSSVQYFAPAGSAKFNLAGRMLSIANVKGASTVQVINMQGVTVAQKTLDANQNLNLANMPVGIYMVRSVEHGISQKIMLK